MYLKHDGSLFYKHQIMGEENGSVINTEDFVKFVREKYRLCWKEIYFKFLAITQDSEQCVTCRANFQLGEMASC